MGSSPRYLEELRVGGGYGDPVDGGANIEKNGNIATDGNLTARGDIAAGQNEAADHALSVKAGAANAAHLHLHQGDDLHGGSVWFDGDADTLKIGTRDGAVDAVCAVAIERGETDVEVLGNLHVHGQVLHAGQARGISPDGLLALWHCENAASLRDWCGRGEDLTPGGSGTTLDDGMFGKGLSFNGSGYFAGDQNLPNNYGTSDLSYACWFKTSRVGTNYLMGWYNYSASKEIRVLVNSGNALMFSVAAGSGVTQSITGATGAHSDGQWHHIAAVRDATNDAILLYFDGKFVGSAVFSGMNDAGTAMSFYLGANNAGSRAIGTLDEVSVWNRALSAEEVLALYAQQQELAWGYDGAYVGGPLTAAGTVLSEGGELRAGISGAVRGVVKATAGAGGVAPGCLTLVSPNGTAWHVFVEDDGTLKIHNALPTQNADGAAVGTQY